MPTRLWVKRPSNLDLWPSDLESGVRVTCDTGYLCANFGLPSHLCSRLRSDVRDRQTDVRQHHRFMPPLIRGGGIIMHSLIGSQWSDLSKGRASVRPLHLHTVLARLFCIRAATCWSSSSEHRTLQRCSSPISTRRCCRRRCESLRRLADAVHDAKRVCDYYTPWRQLRRAYRSRRLLSMMTPSDLISGLLLLQIKDTAEHHTVHTNVLSRCTNNTGMKGVSYGNNILTWCRLAIVSAMSGQSMGIDIVKFFFASATEFLSFCGSTENAWPNIRDGKYRTWKCRSEKWRTNSGWRLLYLISTQ